MPSRRGVLKNMYVNAVEGRDRNDYPAIPSPNPWLEARVRGIPHVSEFGEFGHIKKNGNFQNHDALYGKRSYCKAIIRETGSS